MMTVDEPDRRTPPDDEDRELCDMLNRYVDALHADDIGSRSVMLEKHPELHRLLGCLESLDALAALPEAAPAEKRPSSIDAPTQIGFEPSDNLKRSVGDDEPLEEFGKYELLREIGRGGMGVVFLARQRDLDRTVALKMILSNRLASPDDIRRFNSEAKAAGGVHHPNIVGIHEAGQIRGQHFFAMDYVDGPTLAELLENGPIDPEQAAECIAQVARAVHCLHEHNIVHRDLKPSNILVDETGRPHVTDFGLVKIFGGDSDQTRSGTIVGTPSYMAPEQAAGKSSEISPQTDVYGLGALLYTAILGRPPFERDNPLDTLVDVLEGEPSLPTSIDPALSRELELICMKCLEKDPSRRYASAEDVAEDLERFLKSEPVAARPSGWRQRLRRWARREPALACRLGGLLAAMAIVQTTYLYNTFFARHRHDPVYHYLIMSVFGIWGLASYLFQKLLNREESARFAQFGWAAADVILLTSVLYIAAPPLGPLLIGYPLLIAANGLFFRVRLVVFTTACTASAR
eukprot:g8366.t1